MSQEHLEYSKGRGGAVLFFFSNFEENIQGLFSGEKPGKLSKVRAGSKGTALPIQAKGVPLLRKPRAKVEVLQGKLCKKHPGDKSNLIISVWVTGTTQPHTNP